MSPGLFLFAVLIIGVNFPPYYVAGFMIAVEIIFSLLLINEVRKLMVVRS